MSLQKSIVDAVNPLKAYIQRATGDAVPPYAVIVLNTVDVATQGAQIERQRATIRLYDEYREFGGNKKLNEKAVDVQTALIGNIDVAGLGKCYGTFLNTNDTITRVNSVDVWQKTMIFEFLTSK